MGTSTEGQPTAPLDTKLEVVIIPVADVDRSKSFYQGLGWRLDGDFVFSEQFRVVHLTPPGSACSVMFGKGVTPAAPGSATGRASHPPIVYPAAVVVGAGAGAAQDYLEFLSGPSATPAFERHGFTRPRPAER